MVNDDEARDALLPHWASRLALTAGVFTVVIGLLLWSGIFLLFLTWSPADGPPAAHQPRNGSAIRR